MRNLGRVGFAMEALRLCAAIVVVLVTALATGCLQFADRGCSHGDEIHAALSHEHGDTDHHDRDHEQQGAQASDDHDACPPFCGDCHDCAGCFHPIATEAPALAFVPAVVSLGRPDHVLVLPAQPPRWAPSPPLHVPRAT